MTATTETATDEATVEVWETVWDGHGEVGCESPQALIRALLCYEAPDIGEVFVLTPRTPLGEARLVIHAADRWELSAPVPAGCNLIEDDSCSIDGSEDTLTRTVGEVVAELIECHGLDEGDELEAELTFWRQDGPHAFRLTLEPCALPAGRDVAAPGAGSAPGGASKDVAP